MTARIYCQAVFVDAGGVIVLPDRRLLAGALAGAGIIIDPDAVPRAHYRAVRALDRAGNPSDRAGNPSDRAGNLIVRAGNPAPRANYPRALLSQLGIVPGRMAEAIPVWERLADRRHSARVLWSEPTPGTVRTIAMLGRAGTLVVVVTNSDGHGEENLRASGFDLPVIDSTVVGAAKPDPRIFHAALARAGVDPGATVHVGDTLTNDVAGARAAGIVPIHFDPLRGCRATDHRHVRSLLGIWRHVTPHGTASGVRPKEPN